MATFWEQIGNEIDILLDRKATETNFNIGQQTTYRTVAKCALYVEINNEQELLSVSSVSQKAEIKVVIIGNGSNLLISDNGFDGLVVGLGQGFEGIEINETSVKAGAAVKLPVLARKTSSAGLTGFEWAVGVPGTVGGAIKMNAGGHGSDMNGSVKNAEIIDLSNSQKSHLDLQKLEFGYRTSSIKPHQIVIQATLELHEGVKSESEAKMKEIVQWRLENQPGGQNAGSVFTNPENGSAGQLIEKTGSKGFRIGTAEISGKHANFIQVDPDGKAADVYALMEEVRRRVFEEFGIQLQIETKLVGFD
ncbi:MAG: UDP-N-acetylmuramate dehydrogenase [Actinomycetota bacterium]